MGQRGRWVARAVIAVCAAAAVWLLVTAVRDGWGVADPLASVLGSTAGLVALAVSLRAVPGAHPAATTRPAPPDVPEWWVDRDEAAAVVRALRGRAGRWGSGAPVAITAGLHGAGGFGKTSLARYVAAQRSVQRRFPGGVHLITMGRDVRGRAAVAAKVAEETRLITGDTTEAGSDPERAGAHLGTLLAGRPRTLLIIDDVWEREQLTPFLRGAERSCVRLVTTRRPDVLPAAAVRIEVDRMTVEQARLLLTRRLPAPPRREAVDELVAATGRWALLLGIANKFIADQTATGADPTAAAETLLRRLRAEGPAVQDPGGSLDLNNPDRRNTAVRASIRAASTLLSYEEAERRFHELGIFAEDESVPVDLVATLWRATGNLDETATRALCKQMADLSLLGIGTTVPGGAVTVHDVVRDYLRSELGPAGLGAANAALLGAVEASLPAAEDGAAPWWRVTDGYLLDHLVEHFLDARRSVGALALAGDFRWMRARLHQRGPTAPWRDLDRLGAAGRPLARQLAQAAHLLTPTTPPHALDAVLRSRVTGAPHRPARPVPAGTPVLVDRWPPPDLPDPALMRTLTGHRGPVHAVAYSPDGERVATGSRDTTARIWSSATGEALHILTGHHGPVRAVAFSPDGRLLATGGRDATVRIWDAATGRAVRTVTGHDGAVLAVVFSPDGTLLATGGSDTTVRIWDPATSEPLHTATGHGGLVSAVAFSPDGSRLAAGGADATARIWDVVALGRGRGPGGGPATGVGAPRVLTGHRGPVRALAFSPDGSRLLTCSNDRTLRIWGPGGEEALHELSGVVRAAGFSPDGSRLATGSHVAALRIWDTATGGTVSTLTGHRGAVLAVAFGPDGTRLVTGGNDRIALAWDPTSSGTPVRSTGRSDQLYAVAAAPDGSCVATSSRETSVPVWDPATGEVARTLRGHGGAVLAVAFSPDGTRLATSSSDRTLRLWDMATGATVRTLRGRTDQLDALAFSPDGTRLATGSRDATARLWDPSTGDMVRILNGHRGPVRAVAFSPDGRLLATASHDATVRLWDTSTGDTVRTLTGHTDQLHTVAFSPDGSLLATGGGDTTVRLWDPSTGAVTRLLTGHRAPVRAVAFSPDGSCLATGGADETVRVHAPASGEVLTMMRTDSGVWSCSWSADGRALFAGTTAGLFAFEYLAAV
ncbi:NB-ARC domain-containing protein [Streptomyces fructofermentans]|uniref:WD40 domain-containing protein n=1 Tax=Streptomyces fructofermentans TaxID=152141 RepID=UPI0033DF4BF4